MNAACYDVMVQPWIDLAVKILWLLALGGGPVVCGYLLFMAAGRRIGPFAVAGLVGLGAAIGLLFYSAELDARFRSMIDPDAMVRDQFPAMSEDADQRRSAPRKPTTEKELPGLFAGAGCLAVGLAPRIIDLIVDAIEQVLLGHLLLWLNRVYALPVLGGFGAAMLAFGGAAKAEEGV